MRTWKDVKWSDPSDKVSKYFTVKEALWLPKWNRMANEQDGLTDEAKEAIFNFLNESMDEVRETLGKPIKVHVCFRPKEYNKLVSGAPESCHMARWDSKFGFVAAIDFSCDMTDGTIGEDCDEVKETLKPLLATYKIRLEDNGQGASWVHLDNRAPGPSGRVFKA